MKFLELWNINPEFKRNVWQSLSRERLIAMPVILAGLFWLSHLYDGPLGIINHSLTIMTLLLVVWGSGLAADSIYSEMRSRTWDLQRMTPIQPWTMAWGKLFGSTIFVWYGVLCCLIALVFALIHNGIIPNHAIDASYTSNANDASETIANPVSNTVGYSIIYNILTGIFSISFALFVALLFQRISPFFTRGRVAYIQIFTIIVTFLLFFFDEHIVWVLNQHSWYNLGLPAKEFILAIQIIFSAWLIFGIYRLMRMELLIKNYPWDFLIFLIFSVIFLHGFFYTDGSTDPVTIKLGFIVIVYLCTIFCVFTAAFFSPKNMVYNVTLAGKLKKKQWSEALALLPAWIPGFMFATILLIPVVHLLKEPLYFQKDLDLNVRELGFCVSLLAFLLRDIGIVYLLNWNLDSKPKHLASIVYLIALYTILPMLLSSINFPSYWMPAVAPWTWLFPIGEIDIKHILSILAVILLQAGIVIWMLMGRWKMHLKMMGLH